MSLTKVEKLGSSEALLLHETVRKLGKMGFDITPRQLRHWDRFGLLKPFIDESKYRRYNYDDIDKAVVIFILNKVLKISLPRIKNILVCMKSEKELQELLAKNPLSFMTKRRNANGKEEWYLKRELSDDIRGIDSSLNKFKEGLGIFEKVFNEAQTRFYKELLKFQKEHHKE